METDITPPPAILITHQYLDWRPSSDVQGCSVHFSNGDMIGNKPTNFLWIKATTTYERGGVKVKKALEDSTCRSLRIQATTTKQYSRQMTRLRGSKPSNKVPHCCDQPRWQISSVCFTLKSESQSVVGCHAGWNGILGVVQNFSPRSPEVK